MDKKQILIVDDKESIAKILSVYLGYEIRDRLLRQPDQGACLASGRQHADLIVSDIRMPEMRGDEFLMLLKQDELFRQIPVIMLSSEDSTSERIRLLESGADDYIVKPFNPMELKLRVKKLI